MATKVEIGNATLYLGDCNEIIENLSNVDAVITDPPYGETTHSNAKSNKGKGHGNSQIDFSSITAKELSQILSKLSKVCNKWLIATMEWRHIAEFEKNPPNGWEFVRFGVWIKTNPMPQISADRPAQGWEGIAYLHSDNGIKKQWNGGGRHGNYIGSLASDRLHPTGKPLEMIEQFVDRFTNKNDIVLDPFMGSGTTGVACVKMGRKFIGVEMEQKYFDMACERIENVQRQEALF
jgi:site-specific DNA-methyltransferase (adenine-specific)